MIIDIHKEEFAKIIEHFKNELAVLRTGRANSAMVENLQIESYGVKTPLKQLANISISDAKSITIQPWDKNIAKEIEKVITIADLGLGIKNDGNIIRLILPQMTEDNRKKLVKTIMERQEKAKVAIRSIRDKIRDLIKEQEKNKEVTEDDKYRIFEDLDKITHDYYKEIEKISKNKQEEAMTI